MTDVDFTKNVDSLATHRLEKPKKLSAQNGRYWSEIISQQYNFNRGKSCRSNYKFLIRSPIDMRVLGLRSYALNACHKINISIRYCSISKRSKSILLHVYLCQISARSYQIDVALSNGVGFQPIRIVAL